MNGKFKIKRNGETYNMKRRSYYLIIKLCKLLLFRRKFRRNIKRIIKNNKIVLYLFVLLIIIYSMFYFLERRENINEDITWIGYIWKYKEIFVSAIFIVLFNNIISDISNRKRMLIERYNVCTNISISYNTFLEEIGYNGNEWVSIKEYSEDEILNKITIIKEISDDVLKYHKENIIEILKESDLIKKTNDEIDDYFYESYYISELNTVLMTEEDNSEKIKIILNSYQNLYNYFYSIWNQDGIINSIIDYIISIASYKENNEDEKA